MLKDPKKNFDPTMALINNLISNGQGDRRLKEGVYLLSHHNFGNTIHKKDEYPDLSKYTDENYLCEYGVVDSIEQWEIIYSALIEDNERMFCVAFTKVVKADEPPIHGWRWHKWGEYLGNKNPQHEYIYDEDDSIQEVYCFHVYELDENTIMEYIR